MNKKLQIENDVTKIGKKAKEASFKVSSLTSKIKNDILLHASDNLRKNKDIIIQKNSLDIKKMKKN